MYSVHALHLLPEDEQANMHHCIHWSSRLDTQNTERKISRQNPNKNMRRDVFENRESEDENIHYGPQTFLLRTKITSGDCE